MSKEYLSNPQPSEGFNTNPTPAPPNNNKTTNILLSIIIALLLAIISAVVIISATSKNKDGQNEKGSQSTTEQTEISESGNLSFNKPVANPEMPTNPGEPMNEGSTGSSLADSFQTLASESNAPTENTAGSNAGGGSGGGASSSGSTPSSNTPYTMQEILDYYNNSVNKVINSKAGYTKNRTTTIDSLDGGALLKIQLVVDMVYDFLGEGTTGYKNYKGKADYLSKASLTTDDLSSIKIVNDGGIYTITLGLKSGQSQCSASGSSDTTPLQRSGVYVGKGDKKAFDYKSSENIYTAINGVAKAESVKETVSNATIIAKIDSSTGRMVSLEVKWTWYVSLTNVSYSVANVKSAKGTATSTVVVSDFQW